tara:strand:+ start:26603 stop:26872 length:270 start_codon:yes stop_codon:yes gene_type:complete
MALLKKIVLDVLKPHQPNVLELSQALADAGDDYRVRLTVIEVDEKTETVQIEIEGNAIDFEAVKSVINGMGGSLHSIDEVDVASEVETG